MFSSFWCIGDERESPGRMYIQVSFDLAAFSSTRVLVKNFFCQLIVLGPSRPSLNFLGSRFVGCRLTTSYSSGECRRCWPKLQPCNFIVTSRDLTSRKPANGHRCRLGDNEDSSSQVSDALRNPRCHGTTRHPCVLVARGCQVNRLSLSPPPHGWHT